MLGLFESEIREEWDALATPVLAYIFMDAAKHINGTESTTTRLSQCAGLSIDVFDTWDEQAIKSSLGALTRRYEVDKTQANGAFVQPIIDALTQAAALTAQDPKTIANAVKDVQLPWADIQWKKPRILMF